MSLWANKMPVHRHAPDGGCAHAVHPSSQFQCHSLRHRNTRQCSRNTCFANSSSSGSGSGSPQPSSCASSDDSHASTSSTQPSPSTSQAGSVKKHQHGTNGSERSTDTTAGAGAGAGSAAAAGAGAAAAAANPYILAQEDGSGRPFQLQGWPLEEQTQLQGQLQDQEQARRMLLGSGDEEAMSAQQLAQAARRFGLVAAIKGIFGSLLLVAPRQLAAAALQYQPSALEVCFAQLMGAAVVFRCLLAVTMGRAAVQRRLHSTSCQRVMLGCLLPTINHYLAFKKIAVSALSFSQPLFYLYPLSLIVEFMVHIAAFQVYNPYFLAKLLWPVVFGVLFTQLMPPLPDVQLPKGISPVTAGGAVVLGRLGIRRLLPRALRVVARTWLRSKASKAAFQRLLPEAGPTLVGTTAKLMDFLLPTSPVAWGYFFMMLGHFATMFNAYRPELVFAGQVTPVSQLLKQSWSAGFLAAAFACDALKTAADRNHLAMPENRNLNLCLVSMELLFMTCMAAAMASGVVTSSPYTTLRLATAAVSAIFCLKVWLDSTAAAQSKGWALEPSVSSLDWQQATEQRREYGKVTATAVVALTFLTAFL